MMSVGGRERLEFLCGPLVVVGFHEVREDVRWWICDEAKRRDVYDGGVHGQASWGSTTGCDAVDEQVAALRVQDHSQVLEDVHVGGGVVRELRRHVQLEDLQVLVQVVVEDEAVHDCESCHVPQGVATAARHERGDLEVLNVADALAAPWPFVLRLKLRRRSLASESAPHCRTTRSTCGQPCQTWS